MRLQRLLGLVACLLVVFALGCTGGGEAPTPNEAEPASAAAPEPDLPESTETPEGEGDLVYPVVEMVTSKGTLEIELYPDKAPKTVENFLAYVRSGFYDGTIFHRVIPEFVIQGGGFTPDMTKKETQPPIENEADNGLRNLRGTICMARTNDPHSATSQFFINNEDNPALDHRGKNMRDWGYAVFGKVTVGLDVIDAIRVVRTTRHDNYDDVPVEPVIIEAARVKS